MKEQLEYLEGELNQKENKLLRLPKLLSLTGNKDEDIENHVIVKGLENEIHHLETIINFIK